MPEIKPLTRNQTRDGLMFVIGELRRLHCLLAEAAGVRAGIDEVAGNYPLSIPSAFDAVDFGPVLLQLARYENAIQAAHYKTLFPDLAAIESGAEERRAA